MENEERSKNKEVKWRARDRGRVWTGVYINVKYKCILK